MEQILLKLLPDLECIGQAHEELYDSDVHEQIGNAVMAGYVRRTPGYMLPDQFGMCSKIADIDVRKALAEYIERANVLADEIGLASFHARLAAFQDRAVRTNAAVAFDYEELFGHTPPDWYDEAGYVLWDRVR